MSFFKKKSAVVPPAALLWLVMTGGHSLGTALLGEAHSVA